MLAQGENEEDLLLGFETMPLIMYEHNNRAHRYFPDIFIPSQNKIVEVKSEYTYKAACEITHAAGLRAEIWIFSPKGDILRVIDDTALDKYAITSLATT